VTSDPFNPAVWQPVPGISEALVDITYHRQVVDGEPRPTVRVAFDRPEVRNAFRPGTVDELYRVMDHARMSPDVGVVLLTGNGPSRKDGGWAFCSGGDQRIRRQIVRPHTAGQRRAGPAAGRHRARPARALRCHHHAACLLELTVGRAWRRVLSSGLATER